MPGTRKLGRTSDHRRAMLRAMVTYLFENGKIETTATRAKEVRAMAEKMITLGKRDDLHAKRQVFSFVTKETVAKKVIDEIGRNMQTATAVILVLSKRVCAVVTPLKWQSSSWFNQYFISPCSLWSRGIFAFCLKESSLSKHFKGRSLKYLLQFGCYFNFDVLY